MNLNILDEELSNNQGYIGSAVLNYIGTPLSFKVGDLEYIDIKDEFEVYNNILRDIHKKFKKVGLKAPELIEIENEDKRITLICSGEHQRVHLHIITIFDRDTPIAKMLTQKAYKELMGSIYKST